MNQGKSVLIHPIISEKTVRDKEYNKYVFKVEWNTNRTDVKKFVEDKFNVKVKKVNTIKVPGKKRTLGKYSGKTSRWKKAIVTLGEGQTIKELENI